MRGASSSLLAAVADNLLVSSDPRFRQSSSFPGVALVHSAISLLPQGHVNAN
jgi:hypothetical protein